MAKYNILIYLLNFLFIFIFFYIFLLVSVWNLILIIRSKPMTIYLALRDDLQFRDSVRSLTGAFSEDAASFPPCMKSTGHRNVSKDLQIWGR